MAVYYKFKSAKDFDTVAMDGPFISVGMLKERVFESKHLGRGTDFDLMVSNAQTNEDYNDEDMIPKNTSVLIRRVPGRPRMPIVREQAPKVENVVVDTQPDKSSFLGAESSAMKYPDDSEWDEFGNDLYSIPDVPLVQSNNPISEAPPTAQADEDSKIKALIDTPALDWQRQGDGYGPGRGFGRGMGGRMMGGRGFGGLGLERKTPPQGYICHRCKVPGHFIQHCPTNGDPNFDIKRVKPPTGIPKSMLMATPDGSYALPSGAAAVLKPNEAAFEKEIEGLPSTRSVGDLPPELHCPLCKEVMKDAVLTSKCCFNSFCDKCIRDYIISKSVCICGATNVLADDLLPNKTVRDTINRILESGNSSADNAGSTYQVQDMESKIPQHKVPSPTASAASKGERRPLPNNEVMQSHLKEPVDEEKVTSALQQTLQKGNANDTQQLSEKANDIAPNQAPGIVRAAKVPDASEATHESMTVREPASQGSAQVAEEEVQQKVAPGEAGKKKKKKKVRAAPTNDFQWKNPQDLAENYMMPMAPSNFNPYWGGMHPGMDGFGGPFGGPMPYMGYGMGPLDMPYGGMMPQDPFSMPGYMMPPVPHQPVPHQRDLAEYGMGMNVRPRPIMSKDKFDAWKSDANRRRGESDMRGQREFPRGREIGREFSSGPDVSSKSRPVSQTSGADHHRHNRHRSDRSSPEQSIRDLDPPPRPPKRKYEHSHDRDNDQDRERDRDRDRDRSRVRDHDHHERDHQPRHHHHRPESSSRRSSEPAVKPTSTSAAENKKKASVFSRISFPEEETSSKKRKGSSSSEAPGASSSSVRHKSPSNGYHDDYKSSAMAKAGAVTSGGGRKSTTSVDYESSDDDRHFKRKPSRYEPSPPPQVEWEEDGRHARGSRERDRKHR